MPLKKRIAQALPKFAMAIVITVSSSVACTTAFFYFIDIIMATNFFSQHPTWLTVASISSWVTLAATVAVLWWQHRRQPREGDLTTLANIMVDQLKEERRGAQVATSSS